MSSSGALEYGLRLDATDLWTPVEIADRKLKLIFRPETDVLGGHGGISTFVVIAMQFSYDRDLSESTANDNLFEVVSPYRPRENGRHHIVVCYQYVTSLFATPLSSSSPINSLRVIGIRSYLLQILSTCLPNAREIRSLGQRKVSRCPILDARRSGGR